MSMTTTNTERGVAGASEVPLSDEDAMRLAAETDDGFDGKSVPYLGWYWRDWTCGMVSLVGDHVAIDAARKWDYPDARLSEDDFAAARAALVEMGRAKARLLAILNSYKGKCT